MIAYCLKNQSTKWKQNLKSKNSVFEDKGHIAWLRPPMSLLVVTYLFQVSMIIYFLYSTLEQNNVKLDTEPITKDKWISYTKTAYTFAIKFDGALLFMVLL